MNCQLCFANSNYLQLIAFFLSFSNACAVIQEPKSQVALPNSNATFICSGEGNPYVYINYRDDNEWVNKSFWGTNDVVISDREIYITATDENDVVTFVITILANVANNNTHVKCRFIEYQSNKATELVKLTVANGKII